MDKSHWMKSLFEEVSSLVAFFVVDGFFIILPPFDHILVTWYDELL